MYIVVQITALLISQQKSANQIQLSINAFDISPYNRCLKIKNCFHIFKKLKKSNKERFTQTSYIKIVRNCAAVPKITEKCQQLLCKE